MTVNQILRRKIADIIHEKELNTSQLLTIGTIECYIENINIDLNILISNVSS